MEVSWVAGRTRCGQRRLVSQGAWSSEAGRTKIAPGPGWGGGERAPQSYQPPPLENRQAPWSSCTSPYPDLLPSGSQDWWTLVKPTLGVVYGIRGSSSALVGDAGVVKGVGLERLSDLLPQPPPQASPSFPILPNPPVPQEPPCRPCLSPLSPKAPLLTPHPNLSYIRWPFLTWFNLPLIFLNIYTYPWFKLSLVLKFNSQDKNPKHGKFQPQS